MFVTLATYRYRLPSLNTRILLEFALKKSYQTRFYIDKTSFEQVFLLFFFFLLEDRASTKPHLSVHLARSIGTRGSSLRSCMLCTVENRIDAQKNLFCNRYRITFPRRQRAKAARRCYIRSKRTRL